MKNFLKIFNYSTIVFAVSSVHLFAQNPVSSNSSSDRPANQNNQANFQEMHQKRKENREKIQELKMENQKIRETQGNLQKEKRAINQNSQNQGGSRGEAMGNNAQGGSRGDMGGNTQNQGHHDHSKMDRREDESEKRGNREERKERREDRRDHREERGEHREDRREYREEYRKDAKASGNQQQNRRIENKQAMPENQPRNKNEGSSRDSRGGKQFNNQGSPQQERAPR